MIGYGLASNGSVVGKQYVKVFYITPDNLELTRTEFEQEIDDKWFTPPEEERIAYKFKKEKGMNKTPIFVSLQDNKVFTLDLSKDERYSIEIHEMNNLEKPLTEITIPKNKNNLGNFISYRNIRLLKNEILINLFIGDVTLGKYKPGYVALVNINEYSVKLVEIGSDAAQGVVIY